jgi:hypothetical protein
MIYTSRKVKFGPESYHIYSASWLVVAEPRYSLFHPASWLVLAGPRYYSLLHPVLQLVVVLNEYTYIVYT